MGAIKPSWILRGDLSGRSSWGLEVRRHNWGSSKSLSKGERACPGMQGASSTGAGWQHSRWKRGTVPAETKIWGRKIRCISIASDKSKLTREVWPELGWGWKLCQVPWPVCGAAWSPCSTCCYRAQWTLNYMKESGVFMRKWSQGCPVNCRLCVAGSPKTQQEGSLWGRSPSQQAHWHSPPVCTYSRWVLKLVFYVPNFPSL